MISFALTEEQRIAQTVAADFARDVARPAARAADESGAFYEDVLGRLWGLGLVQAAASGDQSEQPGVLNALALEEIAYGDAALAAALAAPLGFARALTEHGSAAQKRMKLSACAQDDPRFAVFAHVDAGWFYGAGRTTLARRAGTGWRIDGAKAMVPLAERCDCLLVQRFLESAHMRGIPGREGDAYSLVR
jgi:alkylation response protein AidB-like acyl-CoA dehydrogenase